MMQQDGTATTMYISIILLHEYIVMIFAEEIAAR
jgi:hypothetical protein